MKNKSFIAAFSILEAIVSMAITAIVLGLTFLIFSIVTERMLDYKKQNQLTNDLNRLTYSINKDIFDTEKMEQLENEIIFSGYSGDIIKYYVEEHGILRQREAFIDTFNIDLKNIQIDSVSSKTGKLNFQKIKIKISVDSVLMDLNFYKPIFANELLSKKFKNEF